MFDWRTYLAERSAALKNALFSLPFDSSLSPELYWSMECNQERRIALMRQYAEEMDKIIEQIIPIIAVEPITIEVERDKLEEICQNPAATTDS